MSSAMPSPVPVSAPPNHWLWAAVGALGATTIAMGVAMVQMRPEPLATPVPAQSVAAIAAPPLVAASDPAPAPSATVVKQKVPSAPVKKPYVATKSVAVAESIPSVPAAPAVHAGPPAMQPTMQPPVAAPMPPPAPPKMVCMNCGVVEAVTPVERDGAGSGAGAVAGAVLGGLLGNQVGGGTGKTIATVLGAVGGGWAGNNVEKRMKKETVYQVDVRMEDGSVQRVEHAGPVSVGAHVTVNAGVLGL
jgi:outer membrane lipoprotein SlyB